MSCTTLLVGKAASYDGSTLVGRNEDSCNGEWNPKKFVIFNPEDQPRHYRSVISHVEVELPDNPLRYSSTPEAIEGGGIWAAAGINDANVAMNATETITTNELVLAADPLVELIPAVGTEGEVDYIPELAGGLGEEDFVTCVLPYIRSAREGVVRLGALLSEYGTYEMNGIAFSDANEIWWLETIGGHHWIAVRVPDDCVVTMPNQLGIDFFDMEDAFGEGTNFLCSEDLREFVSANHLDLSLDGQFNPRYAFGSHSDADHVYNTPRAWDMQHTLTPHGALWLGPDVEFTPESDDIPWAVNPERKLTVADVKDLLSRHYQGTPYDPYGRGGDPAQRRMYRPIGINRTSELSILQLRTDGPEASRAIHWLAFGSNVFNAIVPQFVGVSRTPEYFSNTSSTVSTESFYWANRLIAAMADAHFYDCAPLIERYQQAVPARALALIYEVEDEADEQIREQTNDAIANVVREETNKLLATVLDTASLHMTNGFSRNDG